nr:hypothetical protein Iba_chr06eCG4870 [Ipomoea batatas]
MPSAPAVVKETTTQPATVVDVSPAVDFAQLNRAVTASPALNKSNAVAAPRR